MNRCLLRPLLAIFVVLALSCGASAQTPLPTFPARIPPMSPKAVGGQLTVLIPPEVLMDGKPARLSPGARIHMQNNLLVLTGALAGKSMAVSYILEPHGLIHEVWILTEAEASAFLPVQAMPSPATNTP